jgi:deoxyribonuclease V
MRIEHRHGWKVTTAEAKAIQLEIAPEISRKGNILKPRFIAGIDVSVNRWEKRGRAAVVVLSWPDLEIVEVQTVEAEVTFPYVPGLLSFREMPLILPAFEKVVNVPDLIIVDGQGIAHPRRIGLAAHLGLCLGIPTIGCAKSRLCGECKEPGNEKGNYKEFINNDEIIGAAVRTRVGVKPVYVSTGHLISLESAIEWVLNCCRGYRLPEPTRAAHSLAAITNNQKTNYKQKYLVTK